MITLGLPRHSKPLVLLCGLALTFYFLPSAQLYLKSAPASPISPVFHPLPASLYDAHLSLQSIVDHVGSVLASLAADYHAEVASRELGFQLGNLTWEGYVRDLSHTHAEFFASGPDSHAADPDLLDLVLDRLSLVPSYPSRPLPKVIYTTDLLSPNQFPDQFKTWTTENPEWDTMFVSDDEIGAWMERRFTGNEGVLKELKGLSGTRGIVKADLFRYLVLFLNGGVYTDTDTACVRPISSWASSPDTTLTHPLIISLPHLIDLASTASSEPERYTTGDEAPSLVVAIESDAVSDGKNWRGESFVRGIQIVQWTLLAKPHHPVLLDVLGRALRTARDVREAEERTEQGQGAAPNVLDWTGPGVFTDAVFRYLLVRYGVSPIDLSGITRPVRIGDVVIMPEHSFRADASEGFQGDDRVVWHGFFGRWKTDS
ncbi:hypothetical protein P7C73_g5330, partial [Tremellales sp. Uapishka_1]